MAYREIILMVHVSNGEGEGKTMLNPPFLPPFQQNDCVFEVKTAQIIDLQYCTLCF